MSNADVPALKVKDLLLVVVEPIDAVDFINLDGFMTLAKQRAAGGQVAVTHDAWLKVEKLLQPDDAAA